MSYEKGMVDIAEKIPMKRVAVASGEILLNTTSISHIKNRTNPKGDVLENAKLAAITAVKKTPELVFMCHPIQITSVKVDFKILDDRVKTEVKVTTIDKTGVEIEALAGVMNALLAILDVSKRFEKAEDGNYPRTSFQNIRVVSKTKEKLS